MISCLNPQLLACILLTLSEAASSYRVLLIPQAGRSHVLALTHIGEGLVVRGHEAFILLPEGLSLPAQLAPGGIAITVVYYGEGMRGELGEEDHDTAMENITQTLLARDMGVRELLKLSASLVERSRRRMLERNEALLERLRALRLDVAVVDHVLFFTTSYLIPHSLGVPWVTYTDQLQPWLVRVPYLPSFVPAKFFAYTERMGFKQRLVNTLANVGLAVYFGFSDIPEDLERYKNYGEFNSMADLVSRSVLFIVHSDIALDYAVPSMPNVIHVGGLSLKTSTGKPLPQDIDQFMGDHTSSVILVTFGSMVSTVPPIIADKLLAAFRTLSEYKIIWRFENRLNLTMPNNVMVRDWLPQNDILSDPRIKLFITHCGSSGQFEAVFHGVPMVAFPLFGDQPYNAARLEHKGYGKAMDIRAFTAEELVHKAREITGDASYKARVSKASQIFRSARETPAERAAYWIEHVIKFGGDHLRSAGSDIALYQYVMIDVLLVVVVIVMTSLVCVYKVMRLAYRRCCKTNRGVDKKKSD